MIQFPKSTEFNRRIPKQKFYSNLSVSADMKRIFVEQIAVIFWKNKLATTTLNVGPGHKVTEIEVFNIKLNQKGLDLKVLELIDKEIPYHILFELEYEDNVQFWIGYKEESQSKQDTFKVNRYYQTEWFPQGQNGLRIEGLNMDAIYEGLIKQIAGEKLEVGEKETVKTAIIKAEEKEKLEKKISSLEAKLRKEKQFNRQVKLNGEIKLLRKELEGLLNE